MKKLNYLRSLFFALVVSLGFTSCIEAYVEPEVDHFAVLTQYMAQNNMDLNHMTTDWVIDAAALNTAGVTNSFVIDLRSAADFATGHIQGAVNSTLANVVTTAAGAGTKPIVITCYTGQNAAVALVALRLSGYRNCKILKWGMSGWNSKFDKWTPNISDRALQSPNWSATNTIQQPVSLAIQKLLLQKQQARLFSERELLICCLKVFRVWPLPMFLQHLLLSSSITTGLRPM